MSCPICRKLSQSGYRPFCSRRCADVDLAHWLRGSYAVPAEDAQGAESDPPTPPGNTGKPH